MLKRHISQHRIAAGFNSLMVEMQENIVCHVSGGNVRICELPGIEECFHKRSGYSKIRC